MPTLVQALPSGPLDIVGDIHGEHEALLSLLSRLGCDPDRATVERPLVFIGDLIDRGPDSPAVVETVMRLVAAGVAQGTRQWTLPSTHVRTRNLPIIIGEARSAPCQPSRGALAWEPSGCRAVVGSAPLNECIAPEVLLLVLHPFFLL